MNVKCAPLEYAGLAVSRLETGILLVSKDQKRTNVMAISWGFFGMMWGKPHWIVPVRTTRLTHDIIASSGEFVVCVQPEEMDDVMNFCGTRSGRDVDKISHLGLKTVDMPEVKVPGIQGSLLTYACKVVHTASAEPHTNHVFYFGEVLGAYRDESLAR